jgi:hypothetical protein
MICPWRRLDIHDMNINEMREYSLYQNPKLIGYNWRFDRFQVSISWILEFLPKRSDIKEITRPENGISRIQSVSLVVQCLKVTQPHYMIDYENMSARGTRERYPGLWLAVESSLAKLFHIYPVAARDGQIRFFFKISNIS